MKICLQRPHWDVIANTNLCIRWLEELEIGSSRVGGGGFVLVVGHMNIKEVY